MRAMRIITFLLAAGFIALGCAKSDKNALFSETDQALIDSLILDDSDIPTDTTNKYEQVAAAATLGQQFFWDTNFSGGVAVAGKILSADATGVSSIATTDTQKFSCATCHNPNLGWVGRTPKSTQLTTEVSLGAGGFPGIHTPTVINSYFNNMWLWSGKADSGWGLISRPIEGAPQKFGRVCVADRICKNYESSYNAIFTEHTIAASSGVCAAVNGTCTCTSGPYGTPSDTCYTGLTDHAQGQVNRIFANFAKAINAYQRLIISKDSAFDKWWRDGDASAMSESAQRGLKVFIGKGNCITCHNGPEFSDNGFHNLGVPHDGGFFNAGDNGLEDGIAALLGDGHGQHDMFRGDLTFSDDTAAGTTKLQPFHPSDEATLSAFRGQFKTPGLRSVSETQPYMHTGQLLTLWDVVNFYSFGGAGSGFNGEVDGSMIPRNLTNDEMLDLVAFLESLEGAALSTTLTTQPTIP